MAEGKRTKIEDTGPGGGDAHDFTEGDLTGIYQGAKEVSTKYGPKQLHAFDTEEGPKVVFGTVMLNRLLKQVEAGTKVDVVQTGRTIKLDNGGKMTEYEVFTY